MNEKNGLDEQSEPQPYGYWDMVGVSNRPYCIKKSYMQRLNVLLSVQVGKCGLLLSKALNMAHWKNPQLNLYQIWNHDLHEALDFIPRFDMDRAVNDTDGYLIELAVMASDIASAGNYTGSIDPKLLDFKTTETLGADDADRLWSAIHDELYIQTENLLDMVGRVGYAVEGIRSQIFVRKMFEDAGAVFAKDFVEMYVADLDQLTFVYKKRYDKITNISESFAGYGQFGDDFDELSYLLHDYDGTLHEMECAMFTRWIADERHIELGHDTVRGIGDMDKIVE
ncbi:MAG: hypothetical protein GQ477_05050, partial [Nanohaloarchaea archaeon]|nr:hypothetical protein [Candidatus Nanohaloarchaea archaeon]